MDTSNIIMVVQIVGVLSVACLYAAILLDERKYYADKTFEEVMRGIHNNN